MTAIAGDFPYLFKPHTYIAPLGTPLPAQSLAVGGAWPVGWIKIKNTANGVLVTPVNPHQDVASDENGVITTLPSGADTINLTWQSRAPEENLIKWLGGFTKNTVLASAEVETLTVTGAATGAGSVTVTLNSVPYTVVVASGDSATVVAGKIAAGSFGTGATGWTAALGSPTTKVNFTQNTAGAVTAPAFSGGATGVTGTFATTTPYSPPYDELYLNAAENNAFQVGLEGTFPDGTLRDLGGNVRLFAYNVQNTDNPQIAFRTTGSDGLVQPVATVRALPGNITTAMLAGTGMTAVDPKGRLSFMII